MLGTLCTVYGWTLSRFMTEAETRPANLITAAEQAEWKDPASGYRRRVVSPPSPGLRGELVEVHMPAGASVSFETAPVAGLEHHLWMLDGALTLVIDGVPFRLRAGDCLRYVLSGASRFENRRQARRALRHRDGAPMNERPSNALTDVLIDDWRPDRPVAASLDEEIAMLGDVLHAVVHIGAGVSFILPFSVDEGRAFWVAKVLPGVRAGTRRVLVARIGSRIVGTVQIDLATPPNQRHRAEVAKLLVHPDARRHGIARRLMVALEAVALSEGRTLLTLDTWTGSHAEQLYRSLGYTTVGVIPRFARGSTTPGLEPTTIMYKELRG